MARSAQQLSFTYTQFQAKAEVAPGVEVLVAYGPMQPGAPPSLVLTAHGLAPERVDQVLSAFAQACRESAGEPEAPAPRPRRAPEPKAEPAKAEAKPEPPAPAPEPAKVDPRGVLPPPPASEEPPMAEGSTSPVAASLPAEVAGANGLRAIIQWVVEQQGGKPDAAAITRRLEEMRPQVPYLQRIQPAHLGDRVVRALEVMVEG